MFDFETIYKNIGYKFQTKELLIQALTHSSITGNKHKNYERLEFLGDRVLGMTIAHLLYNQFANDSEGALSYRFNQLVCADTVADMARRLKLNEFLLVREKEVAESTNVLCDVCEAVIGAIYIDSNIENAISFVEMHWKDLFNKDLKARKDFKTRLQEKLHKLKLPLPVYDTAEKSGTEHNPIFKVIVTSADGNSACGQGHNKKEAEQHAAENLLKILEEKHG